jgi:hypothetical protein
MHYSPLENVHSVKGQRDPRVAPPHPRRDSQLCSLHHDATPSPTHALASHPHLSDPRLPDRRTGHQVRTAEGPIRMSGEKEAVDHSSNLPGPNASSIRSAQLNFLGSSTPLRRLHQRLTFGQAPTRLEGVSRFSLALEVAVLYTHESAWIALQSRAVLMDGGAACS